MTALDNINIDMATHSYKDLKKAEQVIKEASVFFTKLMQATGTGSTIPNQDRWDFSTLLDEKEAHIKKLLSKL